MKDKCGYRDEHGVIVVGNERSALEDHHKLKQIAMHTGISPSQRGTLVAGIETDVDVEADDEIFAVSQLASAVKKHSRGTAALGIASNITTDTARTGLSTDDEALNGAINTVLLRYGQFTSLSRENKRVAVEPSKTIEITGRR